jgi:hypothetical protein
MSNVLTIEEKKKLDRRFRARYIFVASLVATVGALIAALSLIPSLFFISTARAALNAPTIEEVSSARDDQAKAMRAQTLIEALKPLASASTTPSDALTETLALRPTGISISTITYHAGSRSIVLTGTSVRREDVSAYRDALEASDMFSSVVVPLAALAGTQDGRFTITLNGTF